jgi:hypothetical protein
MLLDSKRVSLFRAAVEEGVRREGDEQCSGRLSYPYSGRG